jgi:hypothetical protein
MVLLPAVAAGLLVGWGWAGRRQIKYEAPLLRHLWLVPVAFLPQAFGQTTALLLTLSQFLLIGFAVLNLHSQGMRILLIGAALNFLVMTTNGGFMPISPQTAERLVPQETLVELPTGSRFGAKDILLHPQQTRFEWLADRFLPPVGFPYQVAFSLGDVFIAAGAFWLLAKPNHELKR